MKQIKQNSILELVFELPGVESKDESVSCWLLEFSQEDDERHKRYKLGRIFVGFFFAELGQTRIAQRAGPNRVLNCCLAPRLGHYNKSRLRLKKLGLKEWN